MTVLAQAPKITAVPPDRQADVYAVYSAVLAAPRLSHTDDNSKYLIAALAGAIRRFNDPAECIRVRPGYEAKFNQALSDFAKHKADQFRLERAFSISKPYELLDEDAIQQFYQSRGFAIPNRRMAGL